MKYYDIQEWLDVEPLTYDFVEDTQDSNYYYEYESIPKGFKRFFVYRADTYDLSHNEYINPKYRNLIKKKCDAARLFDVKDPDSYSELLQGIFAKLWLYPESRKFFDTMTSAQTLVNIAADNIRFLLVWDLYDYKIKPFSNNTFIAFMSVQSKSLCGALNKYNPCLRNFVSLYHSIGNYCPVPENFNRARSNFGRYDFWDLTLEKIRECYLADDEEARNAIMSELLHSSVSDEVIERCVYWFWNVGGSQYGEDGWKNYIDRFFMQDYVDPLSYEVIPLWKGHTWKNAVQSLNAMDGQDVEIASAELVNRIIKRGQRMVDAIKRWEFYKGEEDYPF